VAGRRKRSRKASARDIAELASGKASAGDRAEAGMGRFTKKKIGARKRRKRR
jgi:hypothetical protein